MSKYTDQQRLDCLERWLMPRLTLARCRQPGGGTFVEIEDDDDDAWHKGDLSIVGATLRDAIDELLDEEAAAKVRQGGPL